MRVGAPREAANFQKKQAVVHMDVRQTAVFNWENEVALPKARKFSRLTRELIDMTRVGVISEDERERADRAADKIRAIK